MRCLLLMAISEIKGSLRPAPPCGISKSRKKELTGLVTVVRSSTAALPPLPLPPLALRFLVSTCTVGSFPTRHTGAKT